MASGIKTFVVQYRNAEGIKRRMNLGRFGVLTVDRARDLAKLKLAEVIVGEDPADKVRQVRKGMTVSEMCGWYLEEARAGNILGRRSEEHTSELQSLMRISYAVFFLQKQDRPT